MLNRLKNHFATFSKEKSNNSFKVVKPTLSFETLKAMAQEYHDRKQEPPILPGTIETMTWAYDEICAGEDPWTALGNFTNAWYGYAKHMRADLVSEPLTRPEQETEYTHRWAAFCAASVDFLCDRYQVPCPNWVHDPYYTLETPWWRTSQAHDPSMREYLVKITLAPFARRNIFCTNRLFQNKYEMYEWTHEAIAQGMTNFAEIRRYVHEKEMAIHGA